MDCVRANNSVELCGEILQEPVYSHSIYGEDFYNMTVSVKRLSGYSDVLPVAFSGRSTPQALLEAGKSVRVTGQMRSYNKVIDGANRLILTVFAHTMEPGDEQMQNDILLQGYICKPTVYRTTPFNREIADILLAVNRAYNKSDYIPCITWGRNARFAQSLKVGSFIEAIGRIQSREYKKTDEQGNTTMRTAYEVSVSAIALCDAALEGLER